MRWILIFVLMLVSVSPAWSARHALLIGMGDYHPDGDYGPLTQPIADVNAMAKVLGKPEYGFRLTRIMDAKRGELMRKTDAFINSLKADDTVFLYISGHGVQFNNTSYLIPVGAPYNGTAEVVDRDHGALSINLLTAQISEKLGPRGAQVVVLDACRNDITKGDGVAGLQPINTRGTLFHYAASPGERALATSPSQFSFYTHFLLQALEQSPSSRIRDVFENTTEAVIRYSEENYQTVMQMPWMAGNMRGRFCLKVPCLGPKVMVRNKIDGIPQALMVKSGELDRNSTLIVRSNLYRDEVWINGKKYGSTKLEVKLPHGEYTIEVKKSGYHSVRKFIDFQSDMMLRVKLVPANFRLEDFDIGWRLYIQNSDVEPMEKAESEIRSAVARAGFNPIGLEEDYVAEVESLIERPNVSFEGFSILGDWKCRKYSFSDYSVFRYPYFQCRVSRKGNRLYFEKISGSQRISGYLFPNGNKELIFLGGATVNDDPQAVYSKFSRLDSRYSDSVGKVYRKGNVLLALIGSYSGRYTNRPNSEILELVR